MQMNDMRDKIKIIKVVPADGPFDDEPEYVELYSLWAKVEYLKGRELWAAMAVNAESTVRFIIRYREGIDPSMLLEYKGEYYNIISVMPLSNQNRYTAIQCTRLTEGN